MDITDIIEYLKDPSNYPIILVFLSGYVITSAVARRSLKWKSMSQMEKLIVSAFIGVALDIGIIFPSYLVISFWTGSFSLDLNFVFQQSSIWFTYFGGFVALALHIYGYSGTKMLKSLRILFRFLMFFFLFELFVSIIIYIQILAYPVYLQSFVGPIWIAFVLVSLFAFIICGVTFFLTDFLFMTPLLHEISFKTTKFVRRKFLIRKVKKLSIRDRLMFLKPSKLTITAIFIGAIITMASLVIVPFDQIYPFLTPRLQQGKKSVYTHRKLNQIVLLGLQRVYENMTFDCYRMVYVPYNISCPPLNRVRRILLESPSNISENSEVGSPIWLNTWSDIKKMWASPIDNLSYEFISNNETLIIERIWVDWSNLEPDIPISLNITYYESVKRNISVKTFHEIKELENQTKEVYCYIIENREDADLTIPLIEMHRLLFDDVILNSTQIIRNGQELHQDVTEGHVYPHCLVPRSSTVNLTISVNVQNP